MACSIHTYHWPKPRSSESHHIIPRAWQHVWSPLSVPEGRLWDETTVELCPTGHRNVHRYLVWLMRRVAQADKAHSEDRRLEIALLKIRTEVGFGKELNVAVQAPTRWLQIGGSLQYLIDKQQYGYGLNEIMYTVPKLV